MRRELLQGLVLVALKIWSEFISFVAIATLAKNWVWLASARTFYCRLVKLWIRTIHHYVFFVVSTGNSTLAFWGICVVKVWLGNIVWIGRTSIKFSKCQGFDSPDIFNSRLYFGIKSFVSKLGKRIHKLQRCRLNQKLPQPFCFSFTPSSMLNFMLVLLWSSLFKGWKVRSFIQIGFLFSFFPLSLLNCLS